MSSSDDRRGARWLVIESVTIVLSILLALLLDAAWDYRGDRAREREYLDGLRVEFRASAEELALDEAARGVILDRVRRVVETARTGGTAPADSLAPWTASMLNYRFFTPAHAVLEDLTSSGNLGLIRSDSVRRLILDYEQARDRLAVAEERERAFLAEQLEPFLARALPLGDYLPLAAIDNDPVLDRPPPPAAFRRLLSDPELGSLLLLRWERSEVTRLFATSVDRALRRLLAELGD